MENTSHKRNRTIAAATVVVVSLTSFLAFRIESSSRPLPLAQLQDSNGRADEQTCAECHEQAETFWDTGHARTLRRVNEETSKSLLQKLESVQAVRSEGTKIFLTETEGLAVNLRDGISRKAKLKWCFGSGEHAHTWVATLADSHGATDLLEFRWTWYRSTGGFDITPGQPDKTTNGYFGGLGVLFDQPKARRCFRCHSSYLPIQSGKIQEHAIQAGVTCQRCHGPRQKHVESEGKVLDPFWKNANQMESVNRCAECHRRAEEFHPSKITHDNTGIPRFQPVGLTQSACFQQSKMTCLTCHNPHLPLSAQDSKRIAQCVQCHDGKAENHPLCGAAHKDNCLKCHMPKIPLGRPVSFTDHWIRVRENDRPTP